MRSYACTSLYDRYYFSVEFYNRNIMTDTERDSSVGIVNHDTYYRTDPSMSSIGRSEFIQETDHNFSSVREPFVTSR
jgi:hypothetical protein